MSPDISTNKRANKNKPSYIWRAETRKGAYKEFLFDVLHLGWLDDMSDIIESLEGIFDAESVVKIPGIYLGLFQFLRALIITILHVVALIANRNYIITIIENPRIIMKKLENQDADGVLVIRR